MKFTFVRFVRIFFHFLIHSLNQIRPITACLQLKTNFFLSIAHLSRNDDRIKDYPANIENRSFENHIIIQSEYQNEKQSYRNENKNDDKDESHEKNGHSDLLKLESYTSKRVYFEWVIRVSIWRREIDWRIRLHLCLEERKKNCRMLKSCGKNGLSTEIANEMTNSMGNM